MDAPVEVPLIKDSILVCHQVQNDLIRVVKDHMFGGAEEGWKRTNGLGSPVQQWYRRMASGPDAFTQGSEAGTVPGRLIAWKADKSFAPANLFFRTLDTGRLLPMSSAAIRLQVYAHPSFWDQLGSRVPATPGVSKVEAYFATILPGVLHEILLLRSMHDMNGADIPILIVSWPDEFVAQAIEYWTELSKSKWSPEQRNTQFQKTQNSVCQRLLPCFLQADLFVRAMFSDPAVEYVPPFILLLSGTKDGHMRVLFTKPHHVPLPALVGSFPLECNAPSCKEEDCALFRLNNKDGASRALEKDSSMVRKHGQPRHVLCNMWGCAVGPYLEEYAQFRTGDLKRCQHCKEVYYCSRLHQKLDWPQHKDVCEVRPTAN